MIEALGKHHIVQSFNCGEPPLDDYLKKHAWQSMTSGYGRTFVALEPGKPEVCGYFTLAAAAVKFDTIPDHVKRHIPRYPIPTAHLAKLAVHRLHQKKGLGTVLLIEAVTRAVRAAEHVGVSAIDLFALNESARNFYLKYRFTPLSDDPLHLYMSLKKAKELATIVSESPPPG